MVLLLASSRIIIGVHYITEVFRMYVGYIRVSTEDPVLALSLRKSFFTKRCFIKIWSR